MYQADTQYRKISQRLVGEINDYDKMWNSNIRGTGKCKEFYEETQVREPVGEKLTFIIFL